MKRTIKRESRESGGKRELSKEAMDILDKMRGGWGLAEHNLYKYRCPAKTTSRSAMKELKDGGFITLNEKETENIPIYDLSDKGIEESTKNLSPNVKDAERYRLKHGIKYNP